MKSERWELGGIFEVEQLPGSRLYTIRTWKGKPAVKVELNGDLFPAAWHPAMLADLERRWVQRVCPPLRLVSGESRLMSLPDDDPYLLGAPSGPMRRP